MVAHYALFKDWIETTNFDRKVKIHFVKHLESVEKFMMSEDYSGQWLGEFIKHTTKLDELRNQDVKAVVPQLSSLF